MFYFNHCCEFTFPPQQVSEQHELCLSVFAFCVEQQHLKRLTAVNSGCDRAPTHISAELKQRSLKKSSCWGSRGCCSRGAPHRSSVLPPAPHRAALCSELAVPAPGTTVRGGPCAGAGRESAALPARRYPSLATRYRSITAQSTAASAPCLRTAE